ncbi:aspartate aminotransferase family protein [Amycolatopsis panacis]|uniref:Aspartate aminotransferase family protein n=1 Tax=Amycolatopsis panacis TaxID=2340917 RepID=A0A419I3N5_9PSEU|nr:aspartate aminotransferase family protein [Amycolatopsis panacis]
MRTGARIQCDHHAKAGSLPWGESPWRGQGCDRIPPNIPLNDVYRRLLTVALDGALRHVADLPDQPVTVPTSDTMLRQLLGGPAPSVPTEPEAVLDTLLRAAELGLGPTGSSRYFGYVVGGVFPVALAADWLTSAWDQVNATYDMSPLAAVLEDICRGWLVEMFGLPVGTSASFTSSCTLANLICLATARAALLDRVGWDVMTRGLNGAPPITVLVNEHVHASVPRSLRLLGLGGDIRPLVTDGEGRVKLGPLEKEISRTNGGPVIACGQVGELHTGAVDPLRPLCEQIHAVGGWAHFDAAFGLWAATTELRHGLLDGLDLADSWATDAHKWLNVPYESGMALVADADAHRRAMAIHPDYLNQDAGRVRHPIQWGVAFSQRARVIPLWATLTQLGKTGIAELVGRHCALARRLAACLRREPGVVILNDVTLNQVLVRFEHPGGDDDRHTMAVTQAFQRAGVAWASGSGWGGRAVLRFSFVNWTTTDEDVDRAAASLLECHRALRSAPLPGVC